MIIPIVNQKNIPISYVSYKAEFRNKHKEFEKNQILIMAGGVGTRMKPFTEILPKPLVPFKGKPMILNIMDNFKNITSIILPLLLIKKKKF